jgi:DNA-binding transcriptional LysR family regulator
MDWDELRYVLAVKRGGTLTAAAEALGVTRTTVGRRLREAEGRLGVRLFDRTPEGLVATGAGEDLAATAVQIEEEILAAEGRLLGRDAALKGKLCVTTLNFIYARFPDVFYSFIERYPGVELTVRITNEQVSLMRREADVAVRLGNSPSGHLVGRRVGRLNFEVYGARALAERLGPGATLGDFPWLHWDERGDTRFLDQWLQENAPGARVALRSDDYAVLRRALSDGIGVHHLPVCEGDADPALVRLGGRLAEQARDLWVLTLPDLRNNQRIRAFMDHAYEGFAAHREAMEGA